MVAASDPERIPVTVLSGPLGAGKTTLVNRLLRDPGDRRIAVVVNDMGEVNVDAALVEREHGDGVVDLSNGCICCRLQDDLVTEVTRLARDRSFDTLLVEASGISEPLPIARALTEPNEDDDPTDWYRLDTTVTVVDAYGFWKAFDPDESLPPEAQPDRPLTDVFVDQIEFCDVLLLNKCDTVPDDQLAVVEASVRELQRRAVLYRTTYCDVSPETVLETGRFDFDQARQAPGWKHALGGHDHGAAEHHGVESVVYERDRPFHPERFAAWLDDWSGAVIRAKGFAWVASRPDEVLGVSQAGPSVRAGPLGEWGDDERATRLVFIGRDLDAEALAAHLDDCLLRADDPQTWADDPFPIE